jgi:hypothetical protein
MLVKQINKLSAWGLPPTPSMVRAWAAALYGIEPGKNWAAAFGNRHKDELDCRYLSTIDHEILECVTFERLFPMKRDASPPSC